MCLQEERPPPFAEHITLLIFSLAQSRCSVFFFIPNAIVQVTVPSVLLF